MGMSPRSGYGQFDNASGYGNFAAPQVTKECHRDPVTALSTTQVGMALLLPRQLVAIYQLDQDMVSLKMPVDMGRLQPHQRVKCHLDRVMGHLTMLVGMGPLPLHLPCHLGRVMARLITRVDMVLSLHRQEECQLDRVTGRSTTLAGMEHLQLRQQCLHDRAMELSTMLADTVHLPLLLQACHLGLAMMRLTTLADMERLLHPQRKEECHHGQDTENLTMPVGMERLLNLLGIVTSLWIRQI